CLTNISDSVVFTPTTGIQESAVDHEFIVFPNPSSGKELQVRIPERMTNCSFAMFDISGRKLLEHPLKESGKIELPALQGGLYFIRISDDSGTSHSFRHVVK